MLHASRCILAHRQWVLRYAQHATVGVKDAPAAGKLKRRTCRADSRRAGMMGGSASSRNCRADAQLMRACGVRGGGASEELLWRHLLLDCCS